jgi:asparagine synthase (glutamine-hydrolysing)
MCAIVGILTPPLSPSDPEQAAARTRVRAMAHALRHRGPDGEGFFSDEGKGAQVHLGHRRLSIIDPTPAGAQPMTDHTGRFTLVFNGAIYNFIELAAELRGRRAQIPWRGHSDTEVLVEAWSAWGADCLPRLNGMFAFAIWDARERTLHLCRDRFGVKPLYYAWLGEGRLLFASEAKALFAHPALRPAPALQGLAEFLLTHNINHYEEATSLEGVLQVPQATHLRVEPGEPPVLRRYFRIQPMDAAAQRPLSPALTEEARALLTDAVTVRLRSDVPLGGTLSGGLDSSLLTGIVAGPLYRLGRVQPPYRLFLSQFPGTHEDVKGDESPWAERMLASLDPDAVAPLRSTPSDDQLSADLEDVLFHQEEPFADSSICAHYALMRVVRQAGVKVVLTGQGADEIFGGYVSYYYTLLGDLLRRGRLGDALHHARARSRVFKEPVRRLLLGGAYHASPGWLREHLYRGRMGAEYPLSPSGRALFDAAAPRYGGDGLPPGWGLLDAYLLDCIRRWALPHILRQDDRNTMAFGIESRAPYLDYRLAELAFRTQPTVRLGEGYTKLLLREVGKGLMPEEVRLRPDKMGFWSPQRKWLLGSESLVRDVSGTLPEPVASLTDAAAWQAALDGFYRRGEVHRVGEIWNGFLCSLWVRRTLPRMAAAAAPRQEEVR